MASIRISRVTAQSNAPSSLRIAGVQALSGTAAPNAQIRLSGVRIQNAPGGDCWVMSGGVWFAARIHYRASGAWS